MKIYKFKECNFEYAKDQPEYLPLPCYRYKDGEVVSCWSLDWKERLKVLFSGKIFLSILTFNHPLQPQKISVDNPVRRV